MYIRSAVIDIRRYLGSVKGASTRAEVCVLGVVIRLLDRGRFLGWLVCNVSDGACRGTHLMVPCPPRDQERCECQICSEGSCKAHREQATELTGRWERRRRQRHGTHNHGNRSKQHRGRRPAHRAACMVLATACGPASGPSELQGVIDCHSQDERCDTDRREVDRDADISHDPYYCQHRDQIGRQEGESPSERPGGKDTRDQHEKDHHGRRYYGPTPQSGGSFSASHIQIE